MFALVLIIVGVSSIALLAVLVCAGLLIHHKKTPRPPGQTPDYDEFA